MHNNEPHVVGSCRSTKLTYVTDYRYRAAVVQLSSCQTYPWWSGFNCNWNHTSHWWSGV